MIMAWLAARMVPIGAGLAIVVALLAFDRVRIWNAETRGAEKLAAKVERKDNAAAEEIRKADARSRAAEPGRLRGVVRDPNAVSE